MKSAQKYETYIFWGLKGMVEMSKRDTYEARTEKLLEPICKQAEVNIYDVEYVKEAGQWYLRVYIDKEDGVNINDCEVVSRALSEKMDADDFIDDAYILEVSSPGLGRTLKKDKHLEKSIGEEVELKTYKPIEKQKEFVGILTAFDADTVTIETEQGLRTFQKSDLALIRLTFDF